MTTEAALKAWKTMKGPVWKAKRTAKRSQDSLKQWADEQGFHIVYLDAKSGNPRTGIADALLLRIRPKSADQIELYVVQLKGGGAGLTAREMARLNKAAASIKAVPLAVLCDDGELQFLGGEPSFTKAKSTK